MDAHSQRIFTHRAVTKAVYGLLVAVLLLSLGFSSTVSAQQTGPFTAAPLEGQSTDSSIKGLYVNSQGLTSVVVKIKGSPLASYQGDVSGLAATSPSATGEKQLNLLSPASVQYLNYLDQLHAAVKQSIAQIPQAQVVQEYSVVLNAVSVILPAASVEQLASMPNVAAVYPDRLVHPDTDNSPQFIGAPTVWNALGGQESSGEGVIVGVIDTGIWPEHPSFSDPDPSGKAYAAPPAAPSGKPRACQFTGVGTNPGPAFNCNNKLIGAYRMLTTYDSLIGPEPGWTSARDDDGHGTHTSSTAAGNAGVAASIFGVSRGTISGIAPRAYVIMYKALGIQGGFSSDLAAAAEQAIKDGVNVINYSISGGADPFSDLTEQAFLDDYNAGIFVSASAGNSGPTADTTDHRGPWVTTVAASTQNRAFENTATLTSGTNSLTVTGASLTAGVGPAPVMIPPDPLCNTPLAAGTAAGKIVICKRGVTGRAEKGFNVLQGGAVGMILYNQAPNVTDLETDNHYLPATHIQNADGLNVVAFVTAHPDATATLSEGAKVAAQGDVMASFSSRGGPAQSLGVSKPDITAPGVQILAGASPQHLTPAEGGVALGPEGEMFQAIAGTSMSSPHIAGAGALLKALHPGWTPGQIKSALMTTATTNVKKEDGVTPATPYDDGSGRVDLTKAGDPGLTFDAKGSDYVGHSGDLWNANYPSVYVPTMPGIISVTRVAHSTLTYDSTWSLSVVGATGYKVTVPATLTVPAEADGAFSITVDASDIPLGVVESATLWLKETSGSATHLLHLPITFIRTQQDVDLSKSCDSPAIGIGGTTHCTITVTNNAFSPSNVSVTDQLPAQLKVVAGSVTGGTASPDLKTVSFGGSLAAATPPDVTIAKGTATSPYLALSGFGIQPIAGFGDESIANFNTPPFTYAGETYTRLGIVSDGYLIVGGGTPSDVTPANQKFPDPTPPNNVIAPFWTDLNPGAGGAVRVGVLTSGTNKWIVVDFAAVKEFSSTKTDTFEVWIGLSANTPAGQDISFSYGTVGGTGDNGMLTVGAENKFGNRGQNYYYKATGTAVGTLPKTADELRVSSTPGAPGGTQTITFDAVRVAEGVWTNYAHLTSDLFQGIEVASAPSLPNKDALPIVFK